MSAGALAAGTPVERSPSGGGCCTPRPRAGQRPGARGDAPRPSASRSTIRAGRATRRVAGARRLRARGVPAGGPDRDSCSRAMRLSTLLAHVVASLVGVGFLLVAAANAISDAPIAAGRLQASGRVGRDLLQRRVRARRPLDRDVGVPAGHRRDRLDDGLLRRLERLPARPCPPAVVATRPRAAHQHLDHGPHPVRPLSCCPWPRCCCWSAQPRPEQLWAGAPAHRRRRVTSRAVPRAACLRGADPDRGDLCWRPPRARRRSRGVWRTRTTS